MISSCFYIVRCSTKLWEDDLWIFFFPRRRKMWLRKPRTWMAHCGSNGIVRDLSARRDVGDSRLKDILVRARWIG